MKESQVFSYNTTWTTDCFGNPYCVKVDIKPASEDAKRVWKIAELGGQGKCYCKLIKPKPCHICERKKAKNS